MFPKLETERTPRQTASPLPPWQGLRVAVLVAAGVVALFACVLLAYELAVAQVPQHRAALERLIRAQTDLDVRFEELGLRWGWYGPEAVFRRVELGEPGRSAVLLRAPELVVGFDIWQTLRTGQLEAGRITLIAADIDFRQAGPPAPRRSGALHTTPIVGATRILEGWQGGRVDLEGGTLRVPDPGGSANPLVLQIRRASLRRASLRRASLRRASSGPAFPVADSMLSTVSEWSGYGLVFLPERLGRTARLVMRLDGNLEEPAGLSGTVRFEGRRLVFGGWRELFGAMPKAERFLPRAGQGDLSLDLDFASGRVTKASGKVSVGGLEFAAADDPTRTVFNLDHVRGEWRLAQRNTGWRLQVDSLELGDVANRSAPASLNLDCAPSGDWIHGTLEQAPLQAVAALARWFVPRLDLSGVELGGTARTAVFDWNTARAAGRRLRTTAQLVDVSIAPRARGFRLTGLAGEVAGNETDLVADLQTSTAQLEFSHAGQAPPLDGMRVDARLQISRTADGWRIMTEKLELQHDATRLRVEGSLAGDDSSRVPEINAHAELTGAAVQLLESLAGSSVAQAFGATFSRLTAGRIERAQIYLRGPLDATLPVTGFTGSLLLRDAVLDGGGLWPDAREVDARIDWRGPRIHAFIDGGHAGSFALSAIKADWDAGGERVTHITGHVTGPLEEAIAWMRSHPKLQEYAPRVQNIEMRGAASLDFNLTLPADIGTSSGPAPGIQARITAVLEGATLQPVAGIPSIDALRGVLVFDAGYLRRSTLTGVWLGGPVTLNVGERREQGAVVLSIQGRGVLDARHLALAATAGTDIDETRAPAGNAQWSGELDYLAANDSRPAQWHVRADSSLSGVASHLPEPLSKIAGVAVPLHVDFEGSAAAARLRLSLGERLRSLLSLTRRDDGAWQVERGNVQFGTSAPALPETPVVLVQGRLNRLDLPAYVAAWQQLRREPAAPAIRAELVAGEMLVAGRDYADVRVLAERSDAGADLQLQSSGIAGTAHWPAVTNASHPAQFHFVRLNVPDGTAFATSAELIAALGPATELSVDDIIWAGHSIGSGAATIESGGNAVDVTELHLAGNTQDLSGTMHCQSTTCRLKFTLDSSNAAATLEDFGFRPDLTAATATLDGDLEWHVGSDRPPLATLEGRLSMRLEDGTTRADPDPNPQGTPFPLLLVPALVNGMGQGQSAALPVSEPRGLRFARLEGNFELSAGEAVTSNLHFDGDAEILMRGRTGLVTHDYDQQVWILRGGGRLPAAVRHFGPTPRVAAAWLSLRELFAGGGREDGSRAPLRLQGSWDDPIVVAAE
jgi:uncharacterized protein YhdP